MELNKRRRLADSTVTVPDPVPVGVLFVVWMPLRAVRLLCIRPASAVDVHLWRDGFQMVWIHAFMDAAQMVYVEAGRDFPGAKLVRPSMRLRFVRLLRELEIAVTRRAAVAGPKPAGVGELDLGKEADGGRDGGGILIGHLGLILRGVTRQAVSPALPLSIVPQGGT